MFNEQITPGQNGYMGLLPEQTYAPNPWSGLAEQDQMQADKAMSGPSQNMQTMQTMQAQYSKQAYPSFPNEAGVGSQNAFQMQSSHPPQPMISQGTSNVNPWSFQGEALSR